MSDEIIDQLFRQALLLSGAKRSEFLSKLTPDCRPEIERLLQADDSAERQGLYQPLEDISTDEYSDVGRESLQSTHIPPAPSEEDQPARIGNYKILQLIGEGGMGSVYMAEQTEPVKRRVALKVIKAGMGSKEVIARFEAERQALAMMDHQNIAKVLDAGTTDDQRPYFVMELVRGIPITRYCDENRLTPNERLAIFIKVCRAIQHAHQKGIIHRDIKPTNVLVGQADGEPFPKVIDFGLAKALQSQSLTDKTMFTQFGQVVGTLEYMSPEQAEMNIHDVDTRTDVYSLGVLLYELLTGSTPITRERLKGAALDRIIQLIREEDAPRPSLRLSDSGDEITGISAQRKMDPKRLGAILKGDLDWIAIKALEKDRKRRYDGAGSLADDVKRYLGDEVIEARPPSLGYRLGKTVRRHKFAVLTATGMLLLLIAGLVGTGSMWLLADKEAKRARNSEKAAAMALGESQKAQKFAKARTHDLERENYRLGLQTAYERLRAGELDAAQELLIDLPVGLRGWEWSWLHAESEPHLSRIGIPNGWKLMAATPSGNFAVVAKENDSNVMVQVLDASNGSARKLELPGMTRVLATAASSNADHVAILTTMAHAGEEKTVLTVWTPPTGEISWSFDSSESEGKCRLGNGDSAEFTLPELSLSISQDGQVVWAQGYDIRGSGEDNSLDGFVLSKSRSGVSVRRGFGLMLRNQLTSRGKYLIKGHPPFPEMHRFSEVVAVQDGTALKTPTGFSEAIVLPNSTKTAIKSTGQWVIYDHDFEECHNFGKSFSPPSTPCFFSDGAAAAYRDGNQCFVTDFSYHALRLGFLPANTERLFADDNLQRLFVYTRREILTYPLPSPDTIDRLTAVSFDDWNDDDKRLSGSYVALKSGLLSEAEVVSSHDSLVVRAIRSLETGQLAGLARPTAHWHQPGALFAEILDSELLIFEVFGGRELRRVKLQDAPFTTKGLVMDAASKVACGYWWNSDGTGIAQVWNIESGRTIVKVPCPCHTDIPISISEQSLWMLRDGSLDHLNLGTLDWQSEAAATAAAVSSHGDRIAYVEGTRVTVCALPALKCICQFDVPHANNVAISWASKDSRVFVASETSVSICDAENGRVLLSIANTQAFSTCLVLPHTGTTGLIGGQLVSSLPWRTRWPKIMAAAESESTPDVLDLARELTLGLIKSGELSTEAVLNFDSDLAAKKAALRYAALIEGAVDIDEHDLGDGAILAFLAMSHLQLGNKEEATKYRNQLAEVMKLDEFKEDEEALGFVEEVNAMFKQKAAAESKPAKSGGKDDE